MFEPHLRVSVTRPLWTLVTILGLLLATVPLGGGIAGASNLARKSGWGSGSGTVTSSTSNPFIYTISPAWGTSWSFNPMNPMFPFELYDFALLPLAIPKPTFGQYVPELASSWKTGKSTVTIHLRHNARWQNGAPFTSKDVLDTMLLVGTNGNGLWDDITHVAAPTRESLVLTVKKGIAPELALNNALQIVPYPSSQYGRFVTPGLQRQLVRYFPLSATNPTAAAASPEGKAIAAVFKKAEAFAPTRLLGDGPFEETKMDLQSILMPKWNGFWDASKIHVPEVDWLGFASNDANYGTFFSSRFTFSCTAMPYPIVQRFRQTPTNKLATPPNFSQFSLFFNDHQYPYTMTGVRQALAYIINRPTVNRLAMGGQSPYKPVARPDGLFYSINNKWLPKGLYGKLNRYSFDPAKAASLLEGMHFHKVRGHWMLPNGKPWTVTVDGPAGENDTLGMVSSVTKMMNQFGIQTKAVVVGGASFFNDQAKGSFQLLLTIYFPGNAPLSWAASVIGRGQNYTNSGANSGDRGIGFGPMENVPGLGRVNVPETVTTENATMASGPEVRRLTGIWAKFINKKLPYLSLIDKNVQDQYSTKSYTDWPSTHSALWSMFGASGSAGLVLAMQRGFIRPKG